MRVHHIGYLVKDMHKAKEEFINLGYDDAEVVRDEYRGIDICFMENNGTVVELISPYREDSKVSGLIKRIKNSPYHICYVSDNMENDIKELVDRGYVQMSEPKEAPAICGRKVVFLINESIGMIEIVEGE